MSKIGASNTWTWCVRLLLGCSLLGLGGCWGGDLARKDRDVRASWAALQAADTRALALTERIERTWRRSPRISRASRSVVAFNTMNRMDLFDLGEPGGVARYGAARAQLMARLRETAARIASPVSAGLAWKLRGLQKECLAALMRSDSALRSYNTAAVTYNRALGASGRNVTKALLFPGSRQFALLSGE